MDLIAEGLKQKPIRFEDDRKYIVYIHQDKRRNYANPEEIIQAIKVQERIVERAQTAKEQARQLFAQARTDLEKAKRDIEALILGKAPAA